MVGLVGGCEERVRVSLFYYFYYYLVYMYIMYSIMLYVCICVCVCESYYNDPSSWAHGNMVGFSVWFHFALTAFPRTIYIDDCTWTHDM